jgi:hypothetical protein
MLSDPLALVIAALGSVVGALTFVFGLYIKAQDRAYNEMKVMADARHADMKAENARRLARGFGAQRHGGPPGHSLGRRGRRQRRELADADPPAARALARARQR